jgi:hypothetical protein
MEAKSLILLKACACREMVQRWRKPEKSRTWAWQGPVAHKVIHMMCGQWKKRFSIISLGAVSQVDPSFRQQLWDARR